MTDENGGSHSRGPVASREKVHSDVVAEDAILARQHEVEHDGAQRTGDQAGLDDRLYVLAVAGVDTS